MPNYMEGGSVVCTINFSDVGGVALSFISRGKAGYFAYYLWVQLPAWLL